MKNSNKCSTKTLCHFILSQMINIIFILFIVPPCIAAQSWRSSNGPEGGFVFTIAQCKGVLFAGTYGGGIAKSIDTGKTWERANNGLTSLIVHDIVIKGDTLFAGTWGRGIYRSIDMGKSWVTVYFDTIDMDTDIKGMNVVNNVLFAGTKYPKLLCSRDNGKTWVNLMETTGFPKEWFYPVCFTGTEGYVFAGSVDNGIIRSADNGKTWMRVNNGLTDSGVYCLYVKDSVIFAGTYRGGVFKSSNNGASWAQMSDGLPQIENWGIAEVMSISSIGDNLFAGNANGLYYLNGTDTRWLNAKIDTLSLGLGCQKIISLSNGIVLVATCTVGIYKSTADYEHWTKCNNNLHSQLVTCIATGNQVFSTAWYGNVFQFIPEEKRWIDLFRTGDYPVNSVYIDSQDIYIGTIRCIFKISRDGTRRDSIVSNDNYSANILSFTKLNTTLFAGGGGHVFRKNVNDSIWTYTDNGLRSSSNIVASNGKRLFVAGNNGVHLSDDNGETWENKISQVYFKAIAASDSLVVASGYYSGVYASYNGGDTWVPPSQPLPYGSCLAIVKNLVFAGTYGGGVFISRDSAKSWVEINDGLPTMIISALAVDDSLLYAGTEGCSVYFININDLLPSIMPKKQYWRPLGHIRGTLKKSLDNLLIDYSLTKAGITDIMLYDLSGHYVKSLFTGWQAAGIHQKAFPMAEFAAIEYVIVINNNGQKKCIPFVGFK